MQILKKEISGDKKRIALTVLDADSVIARQIYGPNFIVATSVVHVGETCATIVSLQIDDALMRDFWYAMSIELFFFMAQHRSTFRVRVDSSNGEWGGFTDLAHIPIRA